jgi:hypothetical protein
VSAVNSQGKGNSSKSISVTPKSTLDQQFVNATFANTSTTITKGKPAVPAKPIIIPGNQQVTLSWSAVVTPSGSKFDAIRLPGILSKTIIDVDAPISGYNLYWDTKPITAASNKITISGATSTSFIHTALTNDQQYYYAVTAVATPTNPLYSTYFYESDYSKFSQVSVIPTAKRGAAPAALTAVGSNQQTSLSWAKDTSGATNIYYNVYAYLPSGTGAVTVFDVFKENNRIASTSSNSFVHSGLLTGKKYFYVVTSVLEAESDPSALVSVTP